jgi:hypothetical protein
VRFLALSHALADLSARLFSTRPTVAAVGPVGSLAAFEDIVGLLPDRQSAMRVVAG